MWFRWNTIAAAAVCVYEYCGDGSRFQKFAFGVFTSSKCNPVKNTIHVTQKHANDVISPSFSNSQMPPYSSSSIFWKFKQYKYTIPQLIAVKLICEQKPVEKRPKRKTLKIWNYDMEMEHHASKMSNSIMSEWFDLIGYVQFKQNCRLCA